MMGFTRRKRDERGERTSCRTGLILVPAGTAAVADGME